jgi:hypothetical protein
MLNFFISEKILVLHLMFNFARIKIIILERILPQQKNVCIFEH